MDGDRRISGGDLIQGVEKLDTPAAALSDIVGILCSVGAASSAATTEAPHGREIRRGRIPKEPLAL
jgi:hypothetical protein